MEQTQFDLVEDILKLKRELKEYQCELVDFLNYYDVSLDKLIEKEIERGM